MQSPLLPRLWGSRLVHEPAVVVGIPAARLVEVLVGAGVRRAPAGEAVLVDVRLRPVGPRGFAEVPLALVDHVVARSRHHGADVLEVLRQLDLRKFVVRHVLLERVLHAVLRREVAGQHRRARRRAHAGGAERVLKRQTVSLQAREARQMPARPATREMLDRPFLIGDEQDDVHPGHRGLFPPRDWHASQSQSARSHRRAPL